MNDLTQYHENQNRIIELEDKITELVKKNRVQRELKYQAITSRDKVSTKNNGKLRMLVELSLDNRTDLTTKEIAGICFVEVKSVRELVSRIKKERL